MRRLRKDRGVVLDLALMAADFLDFADTEGPVDLIQAANVSTGFNTGAFDV